MRQLKLTILAGLLVALIFALPATAQMLTLATTTISAAQAATDKVVCLTSATYAVVPSTSAEGSRLYINSEPETIQSATNYSATCFNVMRSRNPVPHAILAPVYIGQKSDFQVTDPVEGVACTQTLMKVRPWINLSNNHIFDCVGSTWRRIDGFYAQSCGTTSSCAATPLGPGVKTVMGTVTLSGTTATVSGITPVFTSTATYFCVGGGAHSVAFANSSTSATVLTGTSGETVNYLCQGW